MTDPKEIEEQWLARLISGRVRKKGLRPRLAASIIASFWLAAIFIFGLVQHWVDPDSFESVGDGLWWATQTVTTVGYGDVVPDDGAGRIIAGVLMIGGLSFFAVLTGVITSAFVARAQARRRAEQDGSTAEAIVELTAQLTAVRADLAALSAKLDTRP